MNPEYTGKVDASTPFGGVILTVTFTGMKGIARTDD